MFQKLGNSEGAGLQIEKILDESCEMKALWSIKLTVLDDTPFHGFTQ